MQVIDTKFPEVKIFEPSVFEDKRGFFFETFNRQDFSAIVGRELDFVQDNYSRSSKGVLRGMHYQLAPESQCKLVSTLRGAVYDVVVDLRKSSPNFGSWLGVHMTDENKRQLWIPEGFAHGFLVLSEEADVMYKTTRHWCKKLERSIAWNCAEIDISWPYSDRPTLSDRDSQAPKLRDADVYE